MQARGESGPEEEFTKLSRASVCNWDDTSRYMDYLRTFCVLIAYDAAKSNGQKAWLNIGLSKSLAQLYRAQGHHAINDVQDLENIEMYLETVETTHCLGHSALQTSILHRPLAQPASTDQRTRDKPVVRLVNLLKLLIRIKKHNDTCASTTQGFQPWKIESEFRELQNEVERDRLHYSNTPFPEHEELSENEDMADAHAEAMCFLVCHCCDIVLNLRFLPIPESRSTTGQGVDTSPPCIQFPGAPPLFLLERRKRCEASAEAIVCVAQEIVRNGGFFLHTALLGYCCMQAVFVLINQLHRLTKQQESEKLVESTEFILFLLEAVKKFYSPAGIWVDTISHAKDVSAPLTHQNGTVDDAFRSYFSRFTNIKEPCFVPIASKEGSNQDSAKLNNDKLSSSLATEPKSTADIQGRNNDDAQTVWVDKYASHLSEDIEVGAQDEGLGETPKIIFDDWGHAGPDLLPLSASESRSNTLPTTASDNSHALPSQEKLSSIVRHDEYQWNGLDLGFDAGSGAPITGIGLGASMQLPSSPSWLPAVSFLWQEPTLCELPLVLTPEIFSELIAEE
ncbi:uncharacterized protein G6M90_00g000080 [Metarhizium brunneum]|uniref:Transcription factor domain-containing protein n=1 Tax=Metarhizium brunneum TaxID=500148 RepID=A0A7D5YZQ0_9HYPO